MQSPHISDPSPRSPGTSKAYISTPDRVWCTFRKIAYVSTRHRVGNAEGATSVIRAVSEDARVSRCPHAIPGSSTYPRSVHDNAQWMQPGRLKRRDIAHTTPQSWPRVYSECGFLLWSVGLRRVQTQGIISSRRVIVGNVPLLCPPDAVSEYGIR
eukprot:533683-Rhodomonas_salina.4